MRGRGLFATHGLFITIEGLDGCGKSTQAARLADWLEARTGRGVLRTFEPGGWGGGALRSLILAGDVPDDRTELLLFLADRSGHLASVVLPALSEGRIVLCERYSDSTLAYQVWGRGLSEAFVATLIASCGFVTPDLTVLLDVDAGTAERRLEGRGSSDRIESTGRAFMTRVAEGYRELALRSPERIVAVDAAGTEDEVGAWVESAVLEPLEGLLRAG